VEDLLVLPVDERHLEFELRGIDAENSWSSFTIQTIHGVSLDTCDVDGQVQGTDDAVVTVSECVFDVV